jgi:DnaJ-class molecular chaperone
MCTKARFPPELLQLICQKGGEILDRLLDRYLPARDRGFVGDDAEDAPVADPYRALGLKRTASMSDVKRRVKELAKVFHPDLPSGDAAKMAEVNEAARAILGAGGKRRG